MPRSTVTSAQAAVAFARDVAQLWDRRLGQRLIGIYLIGSLAHGGFSARYSDIDLALIAEEPLESGERDLVHAEAAAHSAQLASKLSLFWTDQYFSVGRFPPLDRVDYLDHALRLSALDKLTSDDHKRYLRALLYPARFVYSWETGAIGSNDEAVAFLQGRATGLDLDVIRRALRCRNEDQDPQALFSERSKLPGLVRVCEELVAEERK